MGTVASTRTDRLAGPATRAVTYRLTSNVTRLLGGKGTEAGGTASAAPPSSEAWKVSDAVPAAVPGFWSVRYSWKPGRTVPSAKLHEVAADGTPTTSVPSSTTVPTPGSARKYRGRSA